MSQVKSCQYVQSHSNNIIKGRALLNANFPWLFVGTTEKAHRKRDLLRHFRVYFLLLKGCFGIICPDTDALENPWQWIWVKRSFVERNMSRNSFVLLIHSQNLQGAPNTQTSNRVHKWEKDRSKTLFKEWDTNGRKTHVDMLRNISHQRNKQTNKPKHYR